MYSSRLRISYPRTAKIEWTFGPRILSSPIIAWLIQRAPWRSHLLLRGQHMPCNVERPIHEISLVRLVKTVAVIVGFEGDQQLENKIATSRGCLDREVEQQSSTLCGPPSEPTFGSVKRVTETSVASNKRAYLSSSLAF